MQNPSCLLLCRQQALALDIWTMDENRSSRRSESRILSERFLNRFGLLTSTVARSTGREAQYIEKPNIMNYSGRTLK